MEHVLKVWESWDENQGCLFYLFYGRESGVQVKGGFIGVLAGGSKGSVVCLFVLAK